MKTLDDFFAMLKRHKIEFVLEGPRIRARNGVCPYGKRFVPHCPLTELCLEETGRVYPPGDYEQAARELGFGVGVADTIAGASDSPGPTGSEWAYVRERLMEFVEKKGDVA